MTDLSIIIINFQTPELTLACLDSIKNSRDTLIKEIIVIDNASRDNSIKRIKQSHPDVTLIAHTANDGFAAANNLAAAQATGKHLWFLNSDTVLNQDTIQKLYDAYTQAGVKAASCKLLNPDGTLQPQGGALPSLANLSFWALGIDDLPGLGKCLPAYQQRYPDYFAYDHPVGWVGGTALLIDRAVYQKLGGFDEQIFMYGEDIDLCMRLAKHGYQIYFFHQPELTHLGQGSSNLRKSLLGEYSGLQYLFTKHKPPWQLPLLRVLLRTGALLRWLAFAIVRPDAEKKDIYKQAFNLV